MVNYRYSSTHIIIQNLYKIYATMWLTGFHLEKVVFGGGKYMHSEIAQHEAPFDHDFIRGCGSLYFAS